MNATDPIRPDDPDELPEISQLMPLHDFPPFQPNASEARPLTPAESRELVLRHVVQRKLMARFKDCKAQRRIRRYASIAAFVVLAALSFPTIDRLNPIDHLTSAVMSVIEDCG